MARVGRNFRYALPVTVSDELLSETWLDNESDISIPNFNCIVKYKRQNTRVGGVAIYQNSSDAVNIITPSMECSVSKSDIYGTIQSSVGDLCLAECFDKRWINLPSLSTMHSSLSSTPGNIHVATPSTFQGIEETLDEYLPPDHECPVKTFHVYQENGFPCAAILSYVNMSANNNKFSILQVLKHNSKDVFKFWQRFGRVGTQGQSELKDFGTNLSNAQAAFETKFLERTGNSWGDIKNFNYIYGKYNLLRIDLNPGIPAQLACAYLKGHLKGRALDWFEVLGYRVIEDKTTDYAHLKQALSEQFPVVRNRSELETRFYSSSQRRDQQPSDFIYEVLKIHKILKLEMSEEKLIDHVISRLEPQILDYVEVRHPRNTANLLQIVDKYEERFMHRQIRGSSEGFRSSGPHENNRFNTRHRQENWRENRNNERYANNSRPQREFNRFENQGFTNNRRFEGRRQNGQSDQPFHSQGGRQSGSRNSSFRGQNERSRNLNF
ncbi:poly polymerase 2 [Trichonephila clavipes]|nr:poly polymerase 2 [Trichonephila clavipes]